MTINRYYEDELTYLRELGEEFARANPKLAAFLGRESDDPDVERLMEAFAFLTGRLRQRLDDELPELATGLLQLVNPQLLKPIPPMTMMTFRPKPDVGIEPLEVPRNTTVASQGVRGTTCLFTTRYPLSVLPLEVDDVVMENRSTSANLTMNLNVTDAIPAEDLRRIPLRLHFSSEREPIIGRTLLLWMLRYLREVTVSVGDTTGIRLSPSVIKPVGFGQGDDVIPYSVNSFWAFRVLQEYLLFPSKFLFVDLDWSEALPADFGHTGSPRITVAFSFSRPLPDQVRVSRRHIELNATPAVNLFRTEAMPIMVDPRRSEYRVRPPKPDESVHGIQRVTGYVQGQSGRITYYPFESFRHDHGNESDRRIYYRSHPRPATVTNGIDMEISFVNGREQAMDPRAETITMLIDVTNGGVAHLLPIGSVTQATGDTPGSVTFRNVSTVTNEVAPPLNDGIQWRLISSLARNFGSLLSVEALRAVIDAYDFRAAYDVAERQQLDNLLAAIISIDVEPFDLFLDGRPVRSRRIVLRVSESAIGGEGELFLFGSVMDVFFAAYASVNSHHVLRVIGVDSNAVYEWAPRIGEASPQ
ncbi:type VI secretion system baseplate subunit TssF [Amorphus orientalis]|uniref:Type VI secretion system protein ImpG n=1 Tax=Amorphus orientalis TaxID=649198 RepID=A0AAE4ARP1_9HYPH|nr:type VI secretion system baseplate subunit TssF [Amorphus orientalis]MDQ0314293.1 type VI secretion system protein ImpG [Amorphus orientalis]